MRSDPWQAGVAVSHGMSGVDYRYGDAPGERGRLETALTAVYPYGRWTPADGFDLRVMLGIGAGELRHVPDGGEPEASGLTTWMGSIGARKKLPSVAGVGLAARPGLDASRQFVVGGLSLTVRLNPAADGHGLSLAVTPRWGARTGGAEALWGDELPEVAGSGGAERASIEASIRYGFASPRGVLTPFAEGGLTHGESRIRLGTRFKASPAPLVVEVSGERRRRAGSAPQHGLNFEVTFSY